MQILAQRWSQDTESLLIFNTKDEAGHARESLNNKDPLSLLMMSQQSQNGRLLKEALEHLHLENQYLKEQLRDSSDLIANQKDMLMVLVNGGTTNAHEIA